MAPEFLQDKFVNEIEILSLTKPRAQKPFPCAWGHDDKAHAVNRGDIYVRVVWKDKGTTKVNSDHICVNCWAGK